MRRRSTIGGGFSSTKFAQPAKAMQGQLMVVSWNCQGGVGVGIDHLAWRIDEEARGWAVCCLQEAQKGRARRMGGVAEREGTSLAPRARVLVGRHA